jgi:hypothetical protein
VPLLAGSGEPSDRWSHNMAVKTVSLRLTMQGNTQIENMTKSVVDALAGTKLSAGIVTVFVKHTTASVMIIEDEPGNILEPGGAARSGLAAQYEECR